MLKLNENRFWLVRVCRIDRWSIEKLVLTEFVAKLFKLIKAINNDGERKNVYVFICTVIKEW